MPRKPKDHLSQPKAPPAVSVDDALPEPRLGIVMPGMVVHWPRRNFASSAPQRRCGPGAIIPFDDPMMNTSSLSREFCDRHTIAYDDDQRFKLAPAPADSTVTPHDNEGARKAYLELQYHGVPFGARDDDGNLIPVMTHPGRAVPGKQHTPVVIPPVDDGSSADEADSQLAAEVK